jgi:outer membrane protein OmpA-like peptidoglycan-associated protein
MRARSVNTKFFLPQTILLLGLMVQCVSVAAQTQPERMWPGHSLAATVISSRAFAQSAPNLKGNLFAIYQWLRFGAAAPAATCSVQPSEVFVGEPVIATVAASKFNPKHALTYIWNPSSGGGKVIGTDATAQINTTNAAPGDYIVTAHVSDAEEKKNNEVSCSANFTVKALPPKNPPSISLSASSASLEAGGTANFSANCTSPDGVPVAIANWRASSGTISGAGASATLNTAGAAPGAITVSSTCTDSRGLNAEASAVVMVENPPPPPPPAPAPSPSVEIAVAETRLALHSIYFPTDIPAVRNPNAGLVVSQQQTLIALAAEFKKYLEARPGAHLILEGHTDPRGRTQYDEELSERRANRVKSFLVEQGISEGCIDTKAFGARHALSEAAVKDAVENDPQLSGEERQEALKDLPTIVLASDRRVDIRLSTTGESSVRQFPLNAADALTLIGGHEDKAKK